MATGGIRMALNRDDLARAIYTKLPVGTKLLKPRSVSYVVEHPVYASGVPGIRYTNEERTFEKTISAWEIETFIEFLAKNSSIGREWFAWMHPQISFQSPCNWTTLGAAIQNLGWCEAAGKGEYVATAEFLRSVR